MTRHINAQRLDNHQPTEFELLLKEFDTKATMRQGDVIIAEVARIEQGFVVLNAGLKSEARLPIEEFLDERGQLEVTEGESVAVSLESFDDGYGSTGLSRQKAKVLSAWADLEKAHKENLNVTGKVFGKVKGGLNVTVKGVRAFLPGSLADSRPTKDLSHMLDQVLEFRVAKIDRIRNNVVLSRKAVLEAESGIDRAKTLENLQEGQIVEGIVKNLAEYGAFVDIGGADGLIHVSDISWKRLRHPSEALAPNQQVRAKIIKIDRERGRISLGIKQLGEDPWLHLSRRFPAGSRLFGKVSNIADYGVFVEMEPGVEGLAHTSELDWLSKNPTPGKMFNIGDDIEVMVLSIDEDKRRASLGIKQCRANPWVDFAAAHAIGDMLTGTVKTLTDFGAFITLDSGVEGLARFAQDGKGSSGFDAADLQKGQTLEVYVLEIDPERERVTLGSTPPAVIPAKTAAKPAAKPAEEAKPSTALGAALLSAQRDR
jgi:small subunit ribosomal protein S1